MTFNCWIISTYMIKCNSVIPMANFVSMRGYLLGLMRLSTDLFKYDWQSNSVTIITVVHWQMVKWDIQEIFKASILSWDLLLRQLHDVHAGFGWVLTPTPLSLMGKSHQLILQRCFWSNLSKPHTHLLPFFLRLHSPLSPTRLETPLLWGFMPSEPQNFWVPTLMCPFWDSFFTPLSPCL